MAMSHFLALHFSLARRLIGPRQTDALSLLGRLADAIVSIERTQHISFFLAQERLSVFFVTVNKSWVWPPV